MRIITTITCILFMSLMSFAQAVQISETLLSHVDRYAPLFGKKSAVLSMDYIKTYKLEGSDTSYHFILNVYNLESELESVSLGSSIFSAGSLLGGGTGVSANVSYQETERSVTMDHEQFLEFWAGVKSVHSHVSRISMNIQGQITHSGKYPNNLLASADMGEIVVAGEYIPTGLTQLKFYFKLGEAVFEMTEPEFLQIVSMIRNVKDDWTATMQGKT